MSESDTPQKIQRSKKTHFDTIKVDEFDKDPDLAMDFDLMGSIGPSIKSDKSNSRVIVKGHYTEIKNPEGKSPLKIYKPQVKIKSTYSKRLELEHIEKSIAEMHIIPDFGYENNVMDKEDCRGWDLFRDFVISADQKYERL